jgi:hypothetical protein
MSWRFFSTAMAAALAGVATFGIMTISAVYPASALPVYLPDIANGESVLNAGG